MTKNIDHASVNVNYDLNTQSYNITITEEFIQDIKLILGHDPSFILGNIVLDEISKIDYKRRLSND